MVFRPRNPEDMGLGVDSMALTQGGPASINATTTEENAQIFVMNNYFGIGLDADLCLEFHTRRENKPEKFNSRLRNKGVYVQVIMRGGCSYTYASTSFL